MRVNCACEEQFDWTIEFLPQDRTGNFRKACPKCKRSYELLFRLVPEKPEFWNF